jgi:hypothetical protein
MACIPQAQATTTETAPELRSWQENKGTEEQRPGMLKE